MRRRGTHTGLIDAYQIPCYRQVSLVEAPAGRCLTGAFCGSNPDPEMHWENHYIFPSYG